MCGFASRCHGVSLTGLLGFASFPAFSTVDVWVSQGFGALAIIFDAIKFTRSKRRALILWGIPAGWSMVFSQYFMGQEQGAAFQGVSSLESLIQSAIGQDNHQHRSWRIFWMILFCGAGFALKAPTSLWWTWLPVGSYGFASLGKVFYRPWVIRLVWLCSSACTLTYSALYGNITIVLQQIMVMTLTLWFLWKTYHG